MSAERTISLKRHNCISYISDHNSEGQNILLLDVRCVLVAGGDCGVVPVEELRHGAPHHHAAADDDGPAALDGDAGSLYELNDSSRSTGEMAS
jgi:hypothetical protein